MIVGVLPLATAAVGALLHRQRPSPAFWACAVLGTGRVLVSPELRQAAGLVREAMLLGMGGHFELWDKASYEAKEAEAMQAPMPDAFEDFAF